MAGPAPTVLLTTPCFPPAFGGIERTSARLVEHLHDVRLHLVASRGSPVEPPPQLPSGVTASWVANEPRGGRVATARLNAATGLRAVQSRPDVVLALHIRAMPAARLAARAAGARVVLVIHAREMTEQPGLAAAAVRWADAIVAVSSHARDLALAAGAQAGRIDIIHPGVDIPVAAPTALADRPGPPRIVTVARIDDEHKGHEALLRALPDVRARIPGVRWSVVGDGRLLPHLRDVAAGLGLQDSVEFLGRIPDAARDALLDEAHVFAMLSRPPAAGAGEGFGMVFVEAGAHGLPVVAGRAPGVVDAVLDGETGFLVDPSRSRDASAALVDVLGDLVRAQELASAGRARAEGLAWPRVVARYREVISRVRDAPRVGTGARGRAWAADLARGVPERGA